MRLTGIKENSKFGKEEETGTIGIKNIVKIAKEKYGLHLPFLQSSLNVVPGLHLKAAHDVKAHQGEVTVVADIAGPAYKLELSTTVPTVDGKITLLGAIQSLFEGSMYTFVFLWTPTLSPNREDIPHGFIFATFMMASMLGSSCYMQFVFAKRNNVVCFCRMG